MNSCQKSNSRSAVLLKRRHSEIHRRRFTTSLKDNQRSLEIVPESDLTDTSQCARILSNASYSEQTRRSFDRNCPARKARRSHVSLSKRIALDTSSASSASETTTGLHLSGFGKMGSFGKRDLQIPTFAEKKCDCNISFIAFV